MQPLPLLFRRIVSVLFFILFAVILVVVSIYASGYRLGDEFTLERTGGIHVSVPVSGTTLFLNGEEVGVSSFLDKSFFIDNLTFGTYTVSAEKDGYRPWHKTLIVERAYVTDTAAFLVPQVITPLPVVIGNDTTATTSRHVSRADFLDVESLFVVATTTATTTEVSRLDPTELVVRDGNVYVRWNRNLERAPSAFCIAPQACVVEISVALTDAEVTRAEFFKGGVVYETEEGIFLSEIDVKQPNIVVPLYEVAHATFRLNGQDEIFILDGEDLFVVTF